MDELLVSSRAAAKAGFHRNQKVHIILSSESCDLDSVVSSLAMAYFLSRTSSGPPGCSLVFPVLNIPRSQFHLRADVLLLLREAGITMETLVFRDEVDLARLHGNRRLALTLVDHNILPSKDSDLQGAVVEVIDPHILERTPSFSCPVTMEMVMSCATLVMEQILSRAPEILDQQLALLLYGETQGHRRHCVLCRCVCLLSVLCRCYCLLSVLCRCVCLPSVLCKCVCLLSVLCRCYCLLSVLCRCVCLPSVLCKCVCLLSVLCRCYCLLSVLCRCVCLPSVLCKCVCLLSVLCRCYCLLSVLCRCVCLLSVLCRCDCLPCVLCRCVCLLCVLCRCVCLPCVLCRCVCVSCVSSAGVSVSCVSSAGVTVSCVSSAGVSVSCLSSAGVSVSPVAGKVRGKDSQMFQLLQTQFPDLPHRDALHSALRSAKFDLSGFTTEQILLNNMKTVAGGDLRVAVSIVYMSLDLFLQRTNLQQEICHFCQSHHLDAVVAMTISFNDQSDEPVRQVAIYSSNLLYRQEINHALLNSHSPTLCLSPASSPYKDILTYHQDNALASRRNVIPVLTHFLSDWWQREVHCGAGGEELEDQLDQSDVMIYDTFPVNEESADLSDADRLPHVYSACCHHQRRLQLGAGDYGNVEEDYRGRMMPPPPPMNSLVDGCPLDSSFNQEALLEKFSRMGGGEEEQVGMGNKRGVKFQ
ncbi:exopolyphosphatase PRUNE1-like isoform X3 [Trachinotus anak]|uniref:exopolyphosphatase PRUNE1-like isoform X3 n=1 Tax=Trachinotus anak TaxID=443729 RepID=UPI0039F2150D